MKAQTTHNIICLEAEWEYSEVTQNVFRLNTQPILNWLREIYECDIVCSINDLAKMAKGFFADKVVHFSSCRTFSNKAESKAFKQETDA